MMIKIILVALALFCSTLSPPVSWAAARQPVRVVYGFDREFPPFSFEDAGGKPVGFEVEILEAVFQNSANLITRPLQWDLIPVELGSGTITVTSGMVKTEERAKVFRFAALPTFSLQIRMFTKTYNRYPNATFLRGLRVAVEQGSYQNRLLENFGGVNIKTFKDKISPIKALYNDEVEAYCGPVQNAYYFMNKFGYSGISTMGTPLGISELRFAVNRDRGDILNLLNDGMQKIRDNGEYDRIYRKWFVRNLTGDESLKLLNKAKEGILTAYVPYSNATRGAAVLSATGHYYAGSAVENKDKRLSVSALTSALAAAITAGDMEIQAAICVNADGKTVPLTKDELAQLHEFGRGILAVQLNAEGILSGMMVGELLSAPATRPENTPQ
ncbi:hypothetical protein FACS1894206_06530 [Deltaproteobacteria bacterium]|nr:hypothetical protein FACS1894206_06530 [Deltaproteobacteria bacterium]